SRRSKVLGGIATVLFLTTVLSLAWLVVLYFDRTAPPEIRVEVSTPSSADPFSFAISPDGQRLVFSAAGSHLTGSGSRINRTNPVDSRSTSSRFRDRAGNSRSPATAAHSRAGTRTAKRSSTCRWTAR